ncbi:MAG: hypothetical protein NVSMB5_26410 [Candidatus Velthaea sp.]
MKAGAFSLCLPITEDYKFSVPRNEGGASPGLGMIVRFPLAIIKPLCFPFEESLLYSIKGEALAEKTEEQVVVVDPTGRVLTDPERAAAENRASSEARNVALAKGHLDPAVLALEAEHSQPQAVNPTPEAIVPFKFKGEVRPEALNSNFAHLGNLVAGMLQANRTFVAALDSMTARLDRYEIPDRQAEVRKANAAERKAEKVDAEAGIEPARPSSKRGHLDNTGIKDGN